MGGGTANLNRNKNLMKDIDINSKWGELTPGGTIYGSGNSADFKTGDWCVIAPEWKQDKCKQCLLCYLLCPDSSIPVVDSKRGGFDFEHCKGCGVCFKACPFGAITYHEKEGEEL